MTDYSDIRNMSNQKFNFVSVCFVLPLFELSIEDAVGKTLSAYPDAFQNAVAAKLVQHQEGVHDTWTDEFGPLYPFKFLLLSGECIFCWVLPGVLVSFGIMHRTKCGWVLRRLVINLFRFS